MNETLIDIVCAFAVAAPMLLAMVIVAEFKIRRIERESAKKGRMLNAATNTVARLEQQVEQLTGVERRRGVVIPLRSVRAPKEGA